MNRNFSLIFMLLAALSIVNAIPLQKRAVNFIPCPKEPPINPLTVTMDPADPVPGGVAKFSITGKLSQPAETGSGLGIGYFGEDQNPIGEVFQMDLCSTIKCPTDELNVNPDNVPTPANLPERYAIIVAVVAPDGQTPLGCAAGPVGPPGGGDAPPPPADGGDAPPPPADGGDTPPAPPAAA